jgi:hypothetical protein
MGSSLHGLGLYMGCTKTICGTCSLSSCKRNCSSPFVFLDSALCRPDHLPSTTYALLATNAHETTPCHYCRANTQETATDPVPPPPLKSSPCCHRFQSSPPARVILYAPDSPLFLLLLAPSWFSICKVAVPLESCSTFCLPRSDPIFVRFCVLLTQFPPDFIGFRLDSESRMNRSHAPQHAYIGTQDLISYTKFLVFLH